MNKAKVELDHKVLDVEILLISVVQGVALASLAVPAVDVIGNFHFEYYLYVVGALLLILTFWSQAIIHTLSFISWPIDLYHNFLYILVAFAEVLVFSQLTNPLGWFVVMSGFFVLAGILYIVVFWLINRTQHEFQSSSKKQDLFHHILSRQGFELKS